MILKKVDINNRIVQHVAVSLLTVIALYIAFWRTGFLPFGENSLLIIDLDTQYTDFLLFLRNNSPLELLYSFHKGMGGSTIGIFSYYLFSPFNLIVYLFPASEIELAIVVIIFCKFIFIANMMLLYLSKHFEKYNICFALFYAISPYFSTYYFNILWLDCFALFPLLVLGSEKAIKERKFRLFIVVYIIMLLSNYYIAYMASLFILIYFFYYAIFCLKKQVKEILIDIRNMICCVLISICLVAPILLPTVVQLQSAKLAQGNSVINLLTDLKLMYNPLLVPTNYLTNSMGLSFTPFLFFTALSVPLVISFFLTKDIQRIKKIGAISVLLILSASMLFKPLYVIWHAFQMPVGYDYRFYFVYIFFFAVVCREGFKQLKVSANLLIFTSIFFACAVISYFIYLNSVNWSSGALIFSVIIFSLVIALLVLHLKKVKNANTIFVSFFVLLTIFEGSFFMKSGFDYWSAHPWNKNSSDVIYKENYDAVTELVNAVKLDDNTFYRIEDINARHYNQPMGLNYNGINHYSSVFDVQNQEILINLGYNRTHYSTIYETSRVDIDSVLGLKYIIANVDTEISDGYIEIKRNSEKVIYYNPYYIPILYKSDVEGHIYDFGDLFQNLGAESGVYKNNSVNYQQLFIASKTAQNSQPKITNQVGGLLNFNIVAESNEQMLSLIPFDSAWQIKINGEIVDYYEIADSFIGFSLIEGENNVEMLYIPNGFTEGTAIALLCSVLLVTIFMFKKIRILVHKNL